MGSRYYGINEPWARMFLNKQEAKPRERIEIDVIVTNHSEATQLASARAATAGVWGLDPSTWQTSEAAAKEESSLRHSVEIPTTVSPGRHVIPVDIRYGERLLPQFAEAVVVVK